MFSRLVSKRVLPIVLPGQVNCDQNGDDYDHDVGNDRDGVHGVGNCVGNVVGCW